jgi:hypothetical protein
MKRREFVQSVTALAAGGVLPSAVASSPAGAATHSESGANQAAVVGDGKSVGPKMTLAELRALNTQRRPEAGQPPQPQDGRFEFHYHLPGSWDNAKWAEGHDNSDPNSPYYGDPYFDREGSKQNEELKVAIAEVFAKIKKIDATDPNGSPWLLAWRMYPNKDHPRWKEFDGCGCNCGCCVPGSWT